MSGGARSPFTVYRPLSLRNPQGTQHSGHNVVGAYVFGFRLEGEYDSMPKNVGCESTNILWDNVGALPEKCVSTRGLRQGDGRPG